MPFRGVVLSSDGGFSDNPWLPANACANHQGFAVFLKLDDFR